MKPVFLITLCTFLMLSACSSLPPLIPLPPDEKQSRWCANPFVSEKTQFVHTISVTLPGETYSQVMGVTTVDPDRRSIHAAILTLEGLVLFEGVVEKDQINIRRAFPPFSSTSFSEGLMNDVRLIFLPPIGSPDKMGKSDQHDFVCRYRRNDASFVDVVIKAGGGWRLIQYDSHLQPVKHVTAVVDPAAGSAAEKTTPSHIELNVDGIVGYSLDLRLIKEAGF